MLNVISLPIKKGCSRINFKCRRTFLDRKEIATDLKKLATEQCKKNVVRMSILEEFCICISTNDIRKFTGQIEKSNDVELEL